MRFNENFKLENYENLIRNIRCMVHGDSQDVAAGILVECLRETITGIFCVVSIHSRLPLLQKTKPVYTVAYCASQRNCR